MSNNSQRESISIDVQRQVAGRLALLRKQENLDGLSDEYKICKNSVIRFKRRFESGAGADAEDFRQRSIAAAEMYYSAHNIDVTAESLCNYLKCRRMKQNFMLSAEDSARVDSLVNDLILRFRTGFCEPQRVLVAEALKNLALSRDFHSDILGILGGLNGRIIELNQTGKARNVGLF